MNCGFASAAPSPAGSCSATGCWSSSDLVDAGLATAPPPRSASRSRCRWRRSRAASLAIAAHLCVLACGRLGMPFAFSAACIFAMLRSILSRSTHSAGVSSSHLETLTCTDPASSIPDPHPRSRLWPAPRPYRLWPAVESRRRRMRPPRWTGNCVARVRVGAKSCRAPFQKTGQRLGQIVQLSRVNSQLPTFPPSRATDRRALRRNLAKASSSGSRRVLCDGAAAVDGNFFGRPKDRPPGSPLIEQRVIEREPRVVEVWTQES